MKIEKQIKDMFTDSFKIFSNEFVTLLLATIVAVLLMIFIITIPPLVFGIYVICNKYVNNKKVKVSDVFEGFDYFFRSWGLFIVSILAIGLGFMLLIIPGLILMVMFQYAAAIAVMKNKGVVDSLKASYNLAKKNFPLSIVLCLLLAILSSIAGVTKIGLLLTFPFSTLVMVVAVKKLS